jgi:hypothetical protein
MAAALCTTGCAQLFGLDETHVNGGDDAIDAAVDGPSVDAGPVPPCDQPLACAGRLCGQFVDYATGQAIRDQSGLAVACDGGQVAPPCTLAVTVVDYVTLENNEAVAVGTVDTCGRISLPVLDDPEVAWAIVAEDSANMYARSGGVVTAAQFDAALGTTYSFPVIDVNSASMAPNGAWLAVAFDQNLNPLEGVQFMLDGNVVSPPSVVYYSDPDPATHQELAFGQTATGPNGSGALLSPTGDLQISGCTELDPLDVRPIANVYLFRGLVCF